MNAKSLPSAFVTRPLPSIISSSLRYTSRLNPEFGLRRRCSRLFSARASACLAYSLRRLPLTRGSYEVAVNKNKHSRVSSFFPLFFLFFMPMSSRSSRSGGGINGSLKGGRCVLAFFKKIFTPLFKTTLLCTFFSRRERSSCTSSGMDLFVF